jgi:glycosyltransferase involved in cell wall biosynthesis
MPMVTVVIPAFNAERHVAEALSSIEEQTFSNIEVVLVDDGSTDKTLQEAERFSDRLDLTIVQQENAGPSAARNTGIRRARGRYCAFLDADDVMLPELLATQTALLEEDPELGLVCTNVMTFDERGVIHPARWNFAEPFVGTVLDRLLLENFVSTSAVMARTNCLMEAGLFSEKRHVAEDYELWLRMAVRSKLGIIDRSLVKYRYRPGSLSDNRLFSAHCALEVISMFWREHPAYLRSSPSVYRRSIARHLANTAAAALVEGKRSMALEYIGRSLWYDFSSPAPWRYLAKAIILHIKPRRTRSSLDINESAR